MIDQIDTEAYIHDRWGKYESMHLWEIMETLRYTTIIDRENIKA